MNGRLEIELLAANTMRATGPDGKTTIYVRRSLPSQLQQCVSLPDVERRGPSALPQHGDERPHKSLRDGRFNVDRPVSHS